MNIFTAAIVIMNTMQTKKHCITMDFEPTQHGIDYKHNLE